MGRLLAWVRDAYVSLTPVIYFALRQLRTQNHCTDTVCFTERKRRKTPVHRVIVPSLNTRSGLSTGGKLSVDAVRSDSRDMGDCRIDSVRFQVREASGKLKKGHCLWLCRTCSATVKNIVLPSVDQTVCAGRTSRGNHK